MSNYHFLTRRRMRRLSKCLLITLLLSASPIAWAEETADTQAPVNTDAETSLDALMGTDEAPAAETAAEDVDKQDGEGLADAGLDALIGMSVQKVTSASKKEESVLDTPAAVYVITQDDLQRLGVSSIAEALRMVPGLQVGHVTASKWSIGSRGFCDVFSNKLLVLVDGRSVYSPLFAGVLWDVQDTVLEDIDRIEVIRGPGATLWGANAVNGIINIVTKTAHNTQGTVAILSRSADDQTSSESLRVGGALGDNGSYRIYTKGFVYDAFRAPNFANEFDDWSQRRSGFRLDYDPSDKDSVTLMGDVYDETSSNRYVLGTMTAPYSVVEDSSIKSSGANMLFRWTKTSDNHNRTTFQAYYDHTSRSDVVMFTEDRNTIDFDLQREVALSSRMGLIYGLGYRYASSAVQNGLSVLYRTDYNTDRLYSTFFQSDYKMWDDRLKLILGSKFEHNDFTGLEVQPNAKFLWTPTDKCTLWGSVSRAVRTPSLADFESQFNVIVPPTDTAPIRVISIISNPNMKSEKLTASELGYRLAPSDNLFFDVSAFWNYYSDLRSAEAGTPIRESIPVDHVHLPLHLQNMFRGMSKGMEMSADWKVSKKWRLRFGSNWMNLWLDKSKSFDITGVNFDTTYPKKQYSVISYWDVAENLQFNTALYRVSASDAPVLVGDSQRLPGYTRLDMTLCFKRKHGLNIDVGIKNALDARHLEAGSPYGEQVTEVGRSFYCKLSRSF